MKTTEGREESKILNVRAALRKHGLKFAGRRLDLVTWRRLAQEIMSNNLKELAPEFSIRDLFELARDEGWVLELPGGFLTISPVLWEDDDWKKIEERLYQGQHGRELGGLGRLYVVCVIKNLQPVEYELLDRLVSKYGPVNMGGIGFQSLVDLLLKEGVLLQEGKKYYVSQLGESAILRLKADLGYESQDLLEERVKFACRMAKERGHEG